MAEANTMATFDRPPVIERLHSNVGKRKSTTPQKFVGEYFRHSQEIENFPVEGNYFTLLLVCCSATSQ